MNTPQKAYKEIFQLLNKYEDIIDFDVSTLNSKANCHLFGLDLNEKYGFNIDPSSITSLDYQRLKGEFTLSRYGGTTKRTITWSDDSTQPEDEILLCVSFSTGAYYFGEDYPTDLFQRFFDELKTYKPDYIDSANKSLYFTLDNGSKIFNAYDSIVAKYNAKNLNDRKLRKIAQIKSELKKLESNS